MWFKTALAYFLIILDVAMFPFSCAGNSNKNKCIYITLMEEEDRYFISNEISTKIPENSIIETPYAFELDEDKYEIIGWIIYHDQDISKEDFENEFITFPYTIKEEDYVGYFQGKRNSVVFAAVVENIEDATA
ncbi:MAG: hypothetical protein NC310_04555 [Roseburia sp.]|nr:hypothetical protein [Anaeroplasma bactoclasticum]MCM1196332.1 hypothetical protein [Roseburia sp.]MCM1557557.1 hypothetical protein [Anaeroplasma bactoclasticum]